VHITKIQQLNNVIELYQTNQIFLTEALKSVQSIFVSGHKHVDCLVCILNFYKLVWINKLKKFLESWKVDILHADNRFLSFSHPNTEHILKEIATRRKDALMSFHLSVSHNKCHVGKIFWLKHPKEILGHLRLWYLNSNR